MRWLNEDEHAAWLSLAAILIKLPAALEAQLERDAGLSFFEYLVLAALSESPGRLLRMSSLAILTNGSLSRLSHVVTRLERRGWVRREPCQQDGRFTNAVLTDDGLAKMIATAPAHVSTVRDLVFDSLTASQVGQLREIGERIFHRVDPSASCPP